MEGMSESFSVTAVTGVNSGIRASSAAMIREEEGFGRVRLPSDSKGCGDGWRELLYAHGCAQGFRSGAVRPALERSVQARQRRIMEFLRKAPRIIKSVLVAGCRFS